jgi:oxygen-independent coproporphyrinogen-3 oxidase
MAKEIELYGQKLGHPTIETIYLGGGTPSVVDLENLKKVFQSIYGAFQIKSGAEISIESNPDSVDKEKLSGYLEIGINRLSIGVQAWQNDLLKLMGRTYEIETVLQSYKLAREAGFKNISLDLMFALPNQTKKQWLESLTKVIELEPEHISCYSLEWDNNSIFGNHLRSGKIKASSDKLDREMYAMACEELEKAGYKQYEISNFSLNDSFKCQHNSDFWHYKDYFGIGTGSESRIGDKTWQNKKSIKAYSKKINEGELVVDQLATLSKEDQIAGYISLALRTNAGLDKKSLLKKLDFDLEKERAEELKKLVEENLIEQNNYSIKLTETGKDLLNHILLQLRIF